MASSQWQALFCPDAHSDRLLLTYFRSRLMPYACLSGGTKALDCLTCSCVEIDLLQLFAFHRESRPLLNGGRMHDVCHRRRHATSRKRHSAPVRGGLSSLLHLNGALLRHLDLSLSSANIGFFSAVRQSACLRSSSGLDIVTCFKTCPQLMWPGISSPLTHEHETTEPVSQSGRDYVVDYFDLNYRVSRARTTNFSSTGSVSRTS